MSSEVDLVRKQFDEEIHSPVPLTASKLSQMELTYLGRSGKINHLITLIAQSDPAQRKELGTAINVLKKYITTTIQQERRKYTLAQADQSEAYDLSYPSPLAPPVGHLHPITQAIAEIIAIFTRLGFIQMSYPEVEWEYFAFDALNMPTTHAARDDFETTFLSGKAHPEWGRMILTPHTSNGQVREMLRVGKPPIRMINIAKCYRPNYDATHTPMFHQFEGLCVDKDISIAHLKGALDEFVTQYFSKETRIRLRPHHFQFTEPSFEVDITCTVCGGNATSSSCNICKSGWLELGGTGIVHPHVLRSGHIDPDVYSGWAFGFGIERIIMMKYGIDDIRRYYSGDIDFVTQF